MMNFQFSYFNAWLNFQKVITFHHWLFLLMKSQFLLSILFFFLLSIINNNNNNRARKWCMLRLHSFLRTRFDEKISEQVSLLTRNSTSKYLTRSLDISNQTLVNFFEMIQRTYTTIPVISFFFKKAQSQWIFSFKESNIISSLWKCNLFIILFRNASFSKWIPSLRFES